MPNTTQTATHNTDKKMKQQALYTASMALSSIQNDIQDIIDEIQGSVRELRKDNKEDYQ